jgi:CspA family cold shock protein
MRLHGTVKWFNDAKGFGFIGRESGPDVFVHFSGISGKGHRSLQESEEVEFEINQSESGRDQAVKVTKAVASPAHT